MKDYPEVCDCCGSRELDDMNHDVISGEYICLDCVKVYYPDRNKDEDRHFYDGSQD